MTHWIHTFDSRAVTQEEVMAAVHKPKGQRTRRDVMILKTRGAIYGCCNRFADNSACDCLETAMDDSRYGIVARPDGCGVMELDLECAHCGVRLYPVACGHVRLDDVCRWLKELNARVNPAPPADPGEAHGT